MLSPPTSLYNMFYSSCKYSILQAVPSMVHPTLDLKTYFAFDFRKFFLNILQHLDMFYGCPIELKREQLIFKKISKNLHHHTFANIFLTCLSNASSTFIQYALTGKEARIENLPVDAYLEIPIFPNHKHKLAFNLHGYV